MHRTYKSEDCFTGSIFTKEYYKLYNLHTQYILHTVFSIFRALNISDHMKSYTPLREELINAAAVHDQAIPSFTWMLDFMAQSGYLEKTLDKGIAYYRSLKQVPGSRTDRIAEEILAIDRDWLPFIELVDSIASQYQDFLNGARSAIEILFYKEKMQLWNNYFNNSFSGYSVFNICGGSGLVKWFPREGGGSILEFGGGTGGAAVALLSAFREAGILGSIERYLFSDVSPVFLRVGNRIITDTFPELDEKIDLKVLDFNKPLQTQKVMPESFDAVYTVNALHVAGDLMFSLQEIHRTLKKDGILVISELVRMSEDHILPQEFIFSLLEGYFNVKTDPAVRKNYGFLTVDSWKRIFEIAGFRNIELFTNAAHDVHMKDDDRPVFVLVIKGQK